MEISIVKACTFKVFAYFYIVNKDTHKHTHKMSTTKKATAAQILKSFERTMITAGTEYRKANESFGGTVAAQVRATVNQLRALSPSELGVNEAGDDLQGRVDRAIGKMIRDILLPIVERSGYSDPRSTVSKALIAAGIVSRKRKEGTGAKGPKVGKPAKEGAKVEAPEQGHKVANGTPADIVDRFAAFVGELNRSELVKIRDLVAAQLAKVERDAKRDELKAAKLAAKEDMKK
jgi:hypothetical protein